MTHYVDAVIEEAFRTRSPLARLMRPEPRWAGWSDQAGRQGVTLGGHPKDVQRAAGHVFAYWPITEGPLRKITPTWHEFTLIFDKESR